MTHPISFIDLAAQQRALGDRLLPALKRVLDHGGYILGQEVGELEKRLADFAQARHAVTCANGTDAITLSLMAEGIGEGDVVLVPSFTFVATAEAVRLVGATPYFVDVEPATFNMCPQSLAAGLEDAVAQGLRVRAIIAVDLFGLPADYKAIEAAARAHGLVLIADAAQSFGGERNGRRVGSLADYTTTSFFPAKPLGCYGDGGAVFTQDDDRADRLRSLRVHGKGTDKYDNVRVGLNSRLDTLQAAILLEKLDIFPGELDQRQEVARRYDEGLRSALRTPQVPEGYRSAWAQYTLRFEGGRDRLIQALSAEGMPTQIYYPTPLHRQTAYAQHLTVPGGLPVSEALSLSVFSIPFHPYLQPDDQNWIIDQVAAACIAADLVGAQGSGSGGGAGA